MTCNRAARDAFTGMAPLFMSWRRAEQTGEGEWSYRDASGHKERRPPAGRQCPHSLYFVCINRDAYERSWPVKRRQTQED